MENRSIDFARSYCKRAGLNENDTEDCAIQFAEHMLSRTPSETDGDVWLRRCARNYVIDYVRAQRRHQAHECGWLETVADDGALLTQDCPDSGPGPDAALLRDEFWRRIENALAQLTPDQKKVFARHYAQGESFDMIAVTLHRTRHATEQLYSRTIDRLRTLLERQGSTETELRQFLPNSSAPVLHQHSHDPE